MEEDKKLLEEMKENCLKGKNYDDKARYLKAQAIENILNELDRLQKENEELKENYKVLENAYMIDSIPKSVIQDKIEELIEELNKEECDMRYDKYDIQEILKELLGE